MLQVNISFSCHDVDPSFLFSPFAKFFLVKCRFRSHPPYDTCPNLESCKLVVIFIEQATPCKPRTDHELDGHPLRGCGHFESEVRMDLASIEAKLSLLDSEVTKTIIPHIEANIHVASLKKMEKLKKKKIHQLDS